MSKTEHKPCYIQTEGDTVRLVQITDTHLCANPGGTLLDMDTDRSLKLVIERALQERGTPDGVLCTGDLSDQGSLQAYRRLIAHLQEIPAPDFWLPGNHDDLSEMQAAVGTSNRLCAEVLAGNWQVILLNSQIPGEVGGRLGSDELEKLRSALERAQAEGLHSLVCLHHQPVAIGSAWIDQQMVEDADQFWEIVDAASSVKGVLWGHVHQQIDKRRGDIALMASPSSCVQFAPGSAMFKADDKPPGYRWLDLCSDGSINTGVSRVTGVDFTVDLESGGYL
ncbi:3',5'-cyclic-AMP phosphodiesterase [Halieaceae bacterium IMCC8485]|jgi:Icc protein|uniref:3',5'-cyclic-AMP phosphodiesterase n=1 Tax=Candidatus Seongchinamella marina TaxID=2518990 RepID=A0ABT3SWW3_9GAMM|nr:3',5'-cyclic-AMP phosphodiesterase [Candidatus Seongchinamella marina]MCX2973754.1 3',5'-cyclic-AMP phosphodiesterase [Candidatus Seongchinamella marina]